MSDVHTAPGRAQIEEGTLRTDRWWLQPVVTFTILLVFVVYATWAAFVGRDYYVTPYLSPFYSPCIAANCVKGAGEIPIIGEWWRLSPALVVLIFPLGFRMTCYYYRKAYYRAFWLSPPACAVAEPHRSYTGERRFPLILQNVHRYFFYIGVIFNVILSIDAVVAFRNSDGQWGHMGLGTLVLVINAVLLWLYTLSCHSCRNTVGGRINHFSRHPVRYWMWTKVTRINPYHMQFAWASLIWVGLSDLYVRLVATGMTDLHFF